MYAFVCCRCFLPFFVWFSSTISFRKSGTKTKSRSMQCFYSVMWWNSLYFDIGIMTFDIIIPSLLGFRAIVKEKEALYLDYSMSELKTATINHQPSFKPPTHKLDSLDIFDYHLLFTGVHKIHSIIKWHSQFRQHPSNITVHLKLLKTKAIDAWFRIAIQQSGGYFFFHGISIFPWISYEIKLISTYPQRRRYPLHKRNSSICSHP